MNPSLSLYGFTYVFLLLTYLYQLLPSKTCCCISAVGEHNLIKIKSKMKNHAVKEGILGYQSWWIFFISGKEVFVGFVFFIFITMHVICIGDLLNV